MEIMHRSSGHSLVELLVTIVIIVILVGLVAYACTKIYAMANALRGDNGERKGPTITAGPDTVK